MHAGKTRGSATASVASTTPARRPRPASASISVSPSRPAVSRGASPGATATATATAAGLAGRTRSMSPAATTNLRGDDAATAISGGATQLGSAAATGAALSHFAHDGGRFEPHAYETTFSVRGHYAHMTVAQGTATLWCANNATGVMDLYSCVTGQHVTSLPPLHEEVAARRAELAELPVNAQAGKAAVTPRSRGLVGVGGGGGGRRPSLSIPSCSSGALPSPPPPPASAQLPAGEVRASALCSTAPHVWVGYTDGSVAVYDALLLKLLSVGQFHPTRVVAVAVLRSGQVVSASTDGLLVLWDTEQGGFAAITRIAVLMQEAAQDGAGLLCAMVAAPDAAQVCCGFEAGHVYAVSIAGRSHEQTPPHLLRSHRGRINDMAVVRDLLFTAAEDGSVCVWYCGGGSAAAGAGAAPGRDRGNSISSTNNALMAPTTPLAQRGTGAVKLLKRVPVKPSVRCLLAEPQTGSVWVAYADGLMERWSANPDDDYGVEEVVENAMTSAVAAASSNSSSSGSGGGGVRALLSLSAVQTMQWLALSSNGVNKVWYGHKNTLEINLAHAITTLAQIVEQDTEDAAAWRERASLLAQKELERRHKYICILEQLNEQRVLMRHYDMWKRAVLYCGARRRRRTALAETLATKARVQLTRAFFGKWASFYDAQQRHMRGYVLSMALSRATEQQQLHGYLLRWQAFVVRRQLRHTAERHACMLARLVDVGTLGACFRQWRALATRTTMRRQSPCVTEEQLALLANKAQRHVLHRVLRRWLAHHEDHTAERSTTPTPALQRSRGQRAASADPPAAGHVSAISRFAAHYARELQQRHARQVLLRWRAWTARRARLASLAAVAALREVQLRYEARQRFFLQWRQRVHARHAAENTAQLKALEVALHRAEADHSDVFEKLQLQRQLDTLQQRQAAEEAHVAHIKAQLAAADQTCSDLRARQQPPQQPRQGDEGSSSSGGGGDGVAAARSASNGEGALSASTSRTGAHGGGGAATSLGLSAAMHQSSQPSLPSHVLLSSTSRGHMAQHAAWYRSLVDQQRLSPIVLVHMPMEDAVHHVMGQLKGNVVNVYTDLALFRQVKDRRRAGTSAVGILLEAFGEVKRLIVTTVRGASANAAAARMGGKATRWPLSMEALDCIPVHHCASVLGAIKTLVVAYDLLQPDDMAGVQSTCEELVVNADWVFLIARACYLRRKPVPPVNNRQLV